jgi:hypothetical protein
VLPHFIGSCSDSTDHVAIVRRCLAELHRAFKFDGEVPSSPSEILELLPLWLGNACELAPVVLLIDGLDQLTGAGAESLRWLPHKLPPGCAVVLSTSPGTPSAKAVAKKGWPTATLQPLDAADKRQIITKYLGSLRKELEADVMTLLVGASQARA